VRAYAYIARISSPHFMIALWRMVLVGFSLQLVACGPTWPVKPLHEGETTYNFRSGLFTVAPVYDDGFSSTALTLGVSGGVEYGLTDAISPWIAIYPAFVSQGVLYLEPGVLVGIITPEVQGLGLSINPRVNLSAGLSFAGQTDSELVGFAIPQFDANIYYESRLFRPYLGISSYFPIYNLSDSVGYLTAPSMNAGLVYKGDIGDMGIDLRFPIRRMFKLEKDKEPGRFGVGFTFTIH
jgi:hypothetical protein